MTVKSKEYHRSFLHYPRRDRRPITPDMFRANQGRAHPPGYVPQTSMGGQSGMQKDTRKYHKALEIVGPDLKEITIEEKGDQTFEKFATRWELVWSRIIIPRIEWRFVPIVDDKVTVVGYYGEVNPENLLIENYRPGANYLSGRHLLEYHRVHVGTEAFFAGVNLTRYPEEFRRCSAFTNIDGEVTAFSFWGASGNGEIHSTDLPALGWLKLLQSGLKLTVSLGKHGLRTLARKPPIPTPMMSAPKTLIGAPVPPGSSLPIKHLGRRTIIADADSADLEAVFTAHSKVASGMYDVLIHGDAKSFGIYFKGPTGQTVWRTVSTSDVATAIRPHLKPGDQIRLIACETGKGGGGPAQELANLLNRTVWAPETTVYGRYGAAILKDGKVQFNGQSSFVPLDGGVFNPFRPKQNGSLTLATPPRPVNQHVIKRTTAAPPRPVNQHVIKRTK